MLTQPFPQPLATAAVASALLGEGVPVEVAAEALGHANPAITSRLYQHVLGDLQGEAIAALDRILANKKNRK